MPAIVTSLQLTATAELSDTGNTFYVVDQMLTPAINYLNLPVILNLTYALAGLPGANVPNSVGSQLAQLTATNCPAITDSIPAAQLAPIQAAWGDAWNPYNGFMGGIVLDLAEREIGRGDASIFGQIFTGAVGYTNTTNQYINSAKNSQNYLGSTFTSMNSLSTGSLTDINAATVPFGGDLSRLGRLIDLTNLNNLGSPLALLQQFTNIAGITPALSTALIQAGLTAEYIDKLPTIGESVEDSVQKQIYTAMKNVTGTNLKNILTIFDIVPVLNSSGNYNFGPIPGTTTSNVISEGITDDSSLWVFDNTSPDTDRYELQSTITNDYNSAAGRCTFEFTFNSTNYFAQNPGGHFAVVVRCNNDAIASGYVQGQGMVIGNVSDAPNPPAIPLPPNVPFAPNPAHPSTQIESFWAGVAKAPDGTLYSGNTLLPNTNGANPILLDGVEYKFTVISEITADGKSYTGYKIMQGTTVIYDQPLVYDYNIWYDHTKSGIVIAHVYENPAAAAWSVTISNKVITWAPVGGVVPSNTVTTYKGNNVKNMADLLNPIKLFPNSYQSLTVKTFNVLTGPNATPGNTNVLRAIYTASGAVNQNLVQYLPKYVLSSTAQ